MKNTYQPDPMGFSDCEELQQEGYRYIRPQSELVVDASNLEEGKTLALCALIEWMRYAEKQRCRLRIINIPARLKKLIGVYQLSKVLVEDGA